MFTQFFDSPRRCVFNAAAISAPLIMTACVSAAWGNDIPPLATQRVPLPSSQRYSQIVEQLLDGQQNPKNPTESSQSAWGTPIPVTPTSSVSIVATSPHASTQNKAPLAWGSGTRTKQTPPLVTPPLVTPPVVEAPKVTAAKPSSAWLQDVPASLPPLASPPSIPRAEATVAAVAKQPVTEPVKVAAAAPTPPRLPPPAVPIVARVAPIPPRVSAPPSDSAGFSYSSRYVTRVPVAVNVPEEEMGLSRSGAFRRRVSLPQVDE